MSNIAWPAEHDQEMFSYLSRSGFSAVEIAPTRIFPEQPYERLDDAHRFARELFQRHGLAVSSMQSMWYGRKENIFGDASERQTLVDYTKKAIDFARAMMCPHLVFGNPKNRIIPEKMTQAQAIEISGSFFSQICSYAVENNVVIGLEANPTIYGTNFVNRTVEAFEYVQKQETDGLAVNLDVGTIINNDDSLLPVAPNAALISHVHISEPHLSLIQRRELHRDLSDLLTKAGYDRYISIEMSPHDDVPVIQQITDYVRKIFR